MQKVVAARAERRRKRNTMLHQLGLGGGFGSAVNAMSGEKEEVEENDAER